MKRVIFCFLILFIFTISAYAETDVQQGQMGQGMMMGQGQQMPGMMCPKMQQMQGQGMMQGGQQMMQMCPMMGQMMGRGMMARDIMQMMADMMKMQQKMIRGLSPVEKKEMMKELDRMIDRTDRMMHEMKGMMPGMMGGMMRQPSDASQCRPACAEQWLKKAIDLHEIHIKDPKTATEASQMEMMDQMKKAYACITTPCAEMSRAPLKEPESKETEKEKTPKTDPHGH